MGNLGGGLLNGAKLVVVPAATVTSANDFFSLLEQQKVTVLSQTPTAIRNLLLSIDVSAIRDLNLRLIICGGEAFPYYLAKSLLSWGVPVWNFYGPTEATVWTSAGEITHPLPESHNISIGRPFANRSVYILDANMQLVPVGVYGEIYIGGDGLAQGYVNAVELTRDKFIANPFNQGGDRLYKTGDTARYLDNGEMEFYGRKDGQVKLRGFRIELGEMETVLASHPAVKEAVVAVIEVTKDDQSLTAYIVETEQGSLNLAQLTGHLSNYLPAYMLPTDIVILEKIPVMVSGKVDRRNLPLPQKVTDKAAFVAPANKIESFIAQLWRQLLGTGKLGRTADFIQLGGHSLLISKAALKLTEKYSIALSPKDIFTHPSVSAIASLIVDKIKAGDLFNLPELARMPRDCRKHYQHKTSASQQSLWFLDKVSQNTAFYNIPTSFKLTGRLNKSALNKAFTALVKQHESLRTTFITNNEVLYQHILEPQAVRCVVDHADVSNEPESSREAKAWDIMQQEHSLSFDLLIGPLCRMKLVKITQENHLLLLTVHHIICDGWSMDVIYRDFTGFYNAFCHSPAKSTVPVEPLPIQFADYSCWHRKWFKGALLDKQRDYWRGQLADFPVLEMPTSYPRPVIPDYLGDTVSFTLPTEVYKGLKLIAAKQNCTFFSVLFSAFSILLARYSGQQDIVVGTPVANRNHPNVSDTIGFFVNMLVLRTDVNSNSSFYELVANNQRVIIGALEHQSYPFETLVSELLVERDLSRNPLFQVALVLQQDPEKLSLQNLSCEQLSSTRGGAKFDLLLEVTESEHHATAKLEYSSALFDGEFIRNMVDNLLVIMTSVIKDPTQGAGLLPLLSGQQYKQLIHQFSGDGYHYPVSETLQQLFEKRVIEYGDKIALKCGEQSLSYELLNRRANRVAHTLRKAGIKPNTFIALFVERSVEVVVGILGILGILKAGAAYVPIDPVYPDERVEYILADSKASCALSVTQLKQRLQTIATNVIKRVVYLDDSAALSTNIDNPLPASGPSDLAYMIYTSGSTGNPKGVLVPNSNVVRLFDATDSFYGFNERDVWTLYHSFSFDFSVWEMWGALLKGGCLLVIPQMLARSIEEFYDYLVSEKVTVLNQTPSAFYQLSHVHSQKVEDRDYHLRYVIFGAEALNINKLSQWTDKEGFSLPTLVNMYGITETTVHVTLHKIAKGANANGIIGRPIADQRVYILDKNLNPVPVGVTGELCVAGPGVARGYLNLADPTANKFVDNLFSNEPGDKMYRSGDMVRWTVAGEIEYVGRSDDQVKVRGYRIELGEIDSKLLSHEWVKEAVSTITEKENGQKEIVAYYVVKSNTLDVTAEKLAEYLKALLPEYMMPAAFVALKDIPLTANGKINKKALPMPSFNQLPVSSQYVEPETDNQRKVVEIWAQVLGLDIANIGINGNYFELGGNSLMVTSLVLKINNQFKVDMRVADIFRLPTVARICQFIEQHNKAGIAFSTVDKRSHINWAAEGVLPQDITPQFTEYRVGNAKAILLTGATGFVGGYLLEELLKTTEADVYCIVRGNSIENCRDKVFNGLRQKLIWDDSHVDRIKILRGDLAEDNLGVSERDFALLEETIDVIYHNGASVNFLYPYEELKKPNVIATQDLIRLAGMKKLKPLHYISTLVVYSSLGLNGVKQVAEDTPLADCDQLYMGYVESKFIAEKLLEQARDRGFPVSIYRFLEVTGHSETGVFNTRSLETAFWKVCYQLGVTEDLRMQKSYAPVDYIVRSVAHISKQPLAVGKNFHLQNPRFTTNVEINEIIRELGYLFDEITYDEWTGIVMATPDNPFFNFTPLINERWTKDHITTLELYALDRFPVFDCSNTQKALAGSGIDCCALDKAYIAKCWSYLGSIGFLDD